MEQPGPDEGHTRDTMEGPEQALSLRGLTMSWDGVCSSAMSKSWEPSYTLDEDSPTSCASSWTYGSSALPYNATLNEDESRIVEYKSVHVHEDVGEQPLLLSRVCALTAKYTVAFLNSSGGRLLFGVDDDGRVKGLPLSRSTRDSLRLGCDDQIAHILPSVDSHLYRVSFIRVLLPQGVHHPEPRPGFTAQHGKDIGGGMASPYPSANELYVFSVEVSRGRAPVYFCPFALQRHGLLPAFAVRTARAHGYPGVAFARLDGSVRSMDAEVVSQRLELGRPMVSWARGGLASVPRDFIGRDDEVKALQQWMSSDPDPVKLVLVTGKPLCGKSALCLRLVQEFSSRYPHFRSRINVKNVSIRDAKITVIRQMFPTQPLDTNTSDPEVDGLYEACFNNRRAILLIENVSGAEEVHALLPISADEVFVLISSRKDVVGLTPEPFTLRLGELSEFDSFRLLEASAGRVLEPEVAQRLVQVSGRLPLILRVLGRAIGRIGMQADALAHVIHDRVIESAIVSAFEAYPREVRDALLAFALFRGSFDAMAAAAVLQRSYVETEAVLGECVELCVLDVNLDKQRYWMNDLLKRVWCHRAHSDAETVTGVKRRFLSYYCTALETITRSSTTPLVDSVDVEAKNLQAALHYADELMDEEAGATIATLCHLHGDFQSLSDASSKAHLAEQWDS